MAVAFAKSVILQTKKVVVWIILDHGARMQSNPRLTGLSLNCIYEMDLLQMRYGLPLNIVRLLFSPTHQLFVH